LSPKSPKPKDPVILAAWIGAAAVVLAAAIGGAATLRSNGGSPGASKLSSPSPASPARGASTNATSATPTAPVTTTSPSGPTWTETTFSGSETFADFVNAGEPLGRSLAPAQGVQVSCRVKGFKVQDGDNWWYRLAASPWDGKYYASSDNFYNTPKPTGNPVNGVFYDERVPVC
jgi:hypothetical protein